MEAGAARCHTCVVPTTHPRYTVTDTGETAELLDLAQQAWPEITDRRQLLLRLIETGGAALRIELEGRAHRGARQRRDLEHGPKLVEVDVLLGDAGWG